MKKYVKVSALNVVCNNELSAYNVKVSAYKNKLYVCYDEVSASNIEAST